MYSNEWIAINFKIIFIMEYTQEQAAAIQALIDQKQQHAFSQA